MRNRSNKSRRRPMGLRALGAGFTVLLFSMLGACDSLLEVENPGAVEATDLENPALAGTIVNSALGQFECALNSYVVSTSLLADETINSSSWLNINPWGWRGVEVETISGSCPGGRGATGLGAYTPLQQAVFLTSSGEELISAFPEEDVVGNKTEMLGLLAAYGGYSHLLLGEGFCEMAIAEGSLMQPAEVIELAEAKFTAAIDYAVQVGNEDLEYFAVLGRARARLNLGNTTGAYTDASEIPAGFVRYSEYSTVDGSRENRMYNMNHLNFYVSANPAAYDALTVGLLNEPDTRVQVENTGETGNDSATEHWLQLKYGAAGADIPIASWEEAKLIMAEARLDEAEQHLSDLRTAQGLPADDLIGLSLQSDAAILAVVLEERRRQLWLEGHRLNDMLRHDIEFPQGSNHKGQLYGPITCMPLPEDEKRANPNIPS
jgi:starch-binding outer membrane protein, SusD/RagB family